MLTLRGVTVRFGAGPPAINEIDLAVANGEQLSVLGPSGSGKSTLLRAICGLEPLTGGRVEWDGQDVTDVPTHRRGFGLMFQDYVLFPHMDVATNVGFGLQSSSAATDAGAASRRQTVEEALDLVGLRGFEKRLPAQLSGGEQQRVALARALAPRPRLLMLDEPLGALDRSLRRSLLDELVEIFRRLETPLIYVTHDHEEALAVGDRVAVMRDGSFEAVSTPAVLWERPPTEFVARFLGFTNIVHAEIVDGRARTPIGDFQLADADPSRASASLLLRPDAFRPDRDGTLVGVVHSHVFRGDHTLVRLDAPVSDGAPPRRLEVEWRWTPIPAIGDHVQLTTDPSGLVLLPLT